MLFEFVCEECARTDMLAVGCEEVSLGTGTCRVVLDLMMSR